MKKICEALTQVTQGSLECIEHFHEVCNNLESECDFSDLWELDPGDYTFQIRWQHKCLVWWAKNVIDKQDKDYFEVTEKKCVKKEVQQK